MTIRTKVLFGEPLHEAGLKDRQSGIRTEAWVKRATHGMKVMITVQHAVTWVGMDVVGTRDSFVTDGAHLFVLFVG